MTMRSKRDWLRRRPNSLRDALDLCKEYARVRLNRSVEQLADQIGLADRFVLYKWLSSGRMPACMIRPYETACGIDFATRWIAASAGKLLVDMPSGRKLKGADVAELHGSFAQAVQTLADLWEGKAQPDAAMAALTAHLEAMAWHRENIGAHVAPELDFGG